MRGTVGSWLLKQPIAHRGYHSGDHACPENSIAACERAIEKEFAIEIDIQSTADDRLVVFHDDNILRMTGIDGAVRSMEAGRLCSFRLLGSDETIPLLVDVLELVGDRVPLLIEIKNRGRVGAMERRLLQLLLHYQGRIAVQSFNPFSIRWFRIHAPRIERGLVSGDFRHEPIAWYRKLILKHLLLSNICCPHFINYDIQSLPNRATDRHRRLGISIIGWTARSMEEYMRARQLCENVVFEGFDPTEMDRDGAVPHGT
ncbi:MAG: glycerophosphodiester phosphodiesterase [bacterium]|nr:MAG: glycerophosphodiester phosphodiesterase [bacterium]